MAETTIKLKDASTRNILIPRQATINYPAPNVIVSFTFPAWIQRYRIRLPNNAPFDYSFEPTMPNFETIPQNQAVLEEVIYKSYPLTIYLSAGVGNARFQITYWCGQ